MKKQITEVCCERFDEWYQSGEISYAYERHLNIDETEWIIDGMAHIYFCPFCGAFIKGYGFGDYDNKYPPSKETRRISQRGTDSLCDA
jgi:hypothetical protein